MILPDFLVQDADGFIHLAGHRIGLQDMAYYYNEGCSAEDLCDIFPTLPLVLVHKLLVFYLENAAEVNGYIATCETEIERQRAATTRGPDSVELRRRLAANHSIILHAGDNDGRENEPQTRHSGAAKPARFI